MTIREYIESSLRPFGETAGVTEDILLLHSLDGSEEYSLSNRRAVNLALIEAVADLMFAPRATSVGESGFSMGWDFSGLGKYYLYMCGKWGVTPRAVPPGLGTLTDKTDIW